MMKQVVTFLTIAVCVALISGCKEKSTENQTPETAQEPTPVTMDAGAVSVTPTNMEAVLVTVEGESLTRGMAMDMARDMAMRQGVPAQMVEQFMAQMGGQFEQQAIDQFINQTLLAKETDRRDITLSDDEIDAVFAEITNSLPEGVTLEQALQAKNMTIEALRENIVENEKMRKLFEAETKDAPVITDEDVAAFYEENADQFKTEDSVTASHILIACDKDADDDTRAKAKADIDAIKVELDNGADFAELAKAHSSCPSKEEGGSLGTFERGRMVPEFEAAAFSQPIGTVGDVVETQFGYHLIKVSDRTEGGQQPLDEVADDIRTHLERQAQGKLFEGFLETLRQNATITYPDQDE